MSRFIFCILALLLIMRAVAAELNIVQTTDLHGHLEFDPGSGDKSGGWLRTASVIQAERRQPGGAIWIDCGDTLEGSFEAAATRGGLPLGLLDELACDIWVPGNHEFDFGAARAVEFLRANEKRVACCNLVIREAGHDWRPTGWRQLERQGLRIAVIGATANHVSNWPLRQGDPTVRIEPLKQRLPAILAEIHKIKPDAIVLAVHQGVETGGTGALEEVAALYPEIALILGGHTHRSEPGRMLGARSWFVQAPHHGGGAVRIKLTMEPGTRQLPKLESRVIFADKKMAADRDLRARHAGELQELAKRARQPVATLTAKINAGGTPAVSCQASELLCQAMLNATGARAALQGKISSNGLSAGTVSELDLFRFIPYENGLLLADLSRSELEAILGEQMRLADSPANAPLHGLRWRWTKSSSRVTVEWPAAAGERLPVVLSSYLADGAGGRFPRLVEILAAPAVHLRDTGQGLREVTEAWLKTHPKPPAAEKWRR
jgi:2',3'-cyclic-nucleotide 2'-phosphodiesterase (5'-nucleotidase family)